MLRNDARNANGANRRGLVGPKPYYRIRRTITEIQRRKIYEEEGIERK